MSIAIAQLHRPSDDTFTLPRGTKHLIIFAKALSDIVLPEKRWHRGKGKPLPLVTIKLTDAFVADVRIRCEPHTKIEGKSSEYVLTGFQTYVTLAHDERDWWIISHGP